MDRFQNIDSDHTRRIRMAEFAAQDKEREDRDEALKRSNKNFVQVYPKGWMRLQYLIKTNPSAARIYAFLAENIDGSAGAVVVSQELMAESLEVHVITIKRQTKYLEDVGALVRIKVGTGVYAYALNPEEIWRSYDDAKDLSAFTTRTLVKKSDKANGNVKRKLRMMMGEG